MPERESPSGIPGLPSLSRMPVPLKLVFSLTIVVLGIGYIVAMVNLYLTYNLTDGKPGLTASDLQRAFYGNRDNTKLAAKINGGSMAQYLPKSGDREIILSWIQDGAGQDGYEKQVRSILTQNCIRCHNPAGLQRFAPLTTYEQVLAVAQIDRGEPVHLWARVAHTHIQAIGLVFLVLGVIFALTALPSGVKSAVIAVPSVMLLVDFGSRFLARWFAGIVYLMMLSGSLLGLSIAVMSLVPLWEMWLKREPEPKAVPAKAGD